jgi:hypothetical protein
MSKLKPPFMRDVVARIDRDIRTSGLLARLSPQDLQTLICLLTYADRSGRCVLSGRDVARSLDLSEKQGAERLKRLPQLRFRGKPLVAVEDSRRTSSARFARFTRKRYRILALPGLAIRRCKRYSGKRDTGSFPYQEARFPLSPPLPPGKTVNFPPLLRKPASGSRAVTARGKGVAGNHNKATQQTGEDSERKRRDPLELLRDQGVSELTAMDIVRNYPQERIERQVEMLPYRDARDPAAMLVKAIREDWDAPGAYAAALRERAVKREKEKARSEEKARQKARQRRIEKVMSELSPQEMKDITARAREMVKATLRGALGNRVPQRLVDAQVKRIISEEYLDKPDG